MSAAAVAAGEAVAEGLAADVASPRRLPPSDLSGDDASAGFEVRLVLLSQKGNGVFHHIFPQVKYKNKWISLEATKPDYKLNEEYKRQTKKKYFSLIQGQTCPQFLKVAGE